MNTRYAFRGLVCIWIMVSLGCSKSSEIPTWAVAAGGLLDDIGSNVATFCDGSCVVVGSFEDTFTIGSGQPNEMQFTSEGVVDIFIARFNTDGTLRWAKQLGGTQEDRANSVAGFPCGSFVVSGSFYETLTFGTGELNETTLLSEESGDVFVARYNPNGSLVWARRANGPLFEATRGIASFPDGSCVITGFFADRLTFGEGEVNETTLLSDDISDAFVARYNRDGTLAWAKQAGGDETYTGNGVATFCDGSCVVAMRIEGTATIGSGEANATILTSEGDTDVALVRYHPNGSLAWAKRAGGISGDTPWGIATFRDGSCVVAGLISEVATFGAGEANETNLVSKGDADIFVARYHANGTLAWAKQAGGTMRDVARDVASFSDGSFAITGRIYDTATFGLGEAGETQITSNGEADIFVAAYNSNGELKWAEQGGGIHSDQGESLSALCDGSFIVTGRFQDTATFHEGDESETQLVSAGGQDVFVSRYSASGN